MPMSCRKSAPTSDDGKFVYAVDDDGWSSA